MSVFMVIIDEKLEAVKEQIERHYPENYPYHSNTKVILVRTDDIAEKIAVNIGIKGDEKIGGAVFKLNSSYAGFTSRALWDWLNKDNG